MNRIGVFSLTYLSRGHSREYIDNFVTYMSKWFNLKVFYFEQVNCTDGFNKLDLKPNQHFPFYQRVLRRFYISIKYFLMNRKEIRSHDIIYYADYEYISLLFGLFLFNKNRNVVLIHSASVDKSSLYRFYKKFFFKIINLCNVESFIVNGYGAKEELSNYIKTIPIHVVQFPSELKVDPIDKDLAKLTLFKKKPKVISLIGMIRPDKNYEFAIKAFCKSIAFNNNDFLLHITGAPTGVTEAEIKSWIKKYKITNYVLNLAYLSEYELNYAFSSTDILLIPYGNLGTSQSGPLSLCRFYLIPAIVRDGCEISEYVKSNNVGLCCSDFDSFVLSINQLLEYVPIDMVNSIKIAKSLYSWSSASKKYLEVFNGK